MVQEDIDMGQWNWGKEHLHPKALKDASSSKSLSSLAKHAKHFSEQMRQNRRSRKTLNLYPDKQPDDQPE